MERGIQTKDQLKRVLKLEKEIYIKKGWGMKRSLRILMNDVSIPLYRYVCLLRKAEYHHNQSLQKMKHRRDLAGFYHRVLYIWYSRRKNDLGLKLGLEIWDNVFEEGLTIYHPGYVVVNGLAHVGKNCQLHGSNCIGNDGKTAAVPVIGDNVRLGVGASVIGGVHIANNVTIAAGAVVISSCEVEGATLAGVPAKIVKVEEPTPPRQIINDIPQRAGTQCGQHSSSLPNVGDPSLLILEKMHRKDNDRTGDRS